MNKSATTAAIALRINETRMIPPYIFCSKTRRDRAGQRNQAASVSTSSTTDEVSTRPSRPGSGSTRL